MSEYSIVFKKDGHEMFRYTPGNVTGNIAREFRANFGLTTAAAFYEFGRPELRDVDSWIKLVWLADRMGANTLTPDAVEALVGTRGNIEQHWTWEEDAPADEAPVALENTSPEG
jgi:hypothetical protein